MPIFFKYESNAAENLLFRVDALRRDAQGNVTAGGSSIEDAYSFAAKFLLEGRIKILKWNYRRSEFRVVLEDIYDSLLRTD